MNNQVLGVSIVVICSIAGWYVVLHKYFMLKAMLKTRASQVAQPNTSSAHTPMGPPSQPILSQPQATKFLQDIEFALENHIPGMGPPPLASMPFSLPPEVLATMKQAAKSTHEVNQTMDATKKIPIEQEQQKRLVCNWASIIHISGLAIITGIPFLNVIIPVILWLLKKEQHPYLLKQGREVINFQITWSIIQFICLGLGSAFIWVYPTAAANLLAWTKTIRIVFATGMYIPFNLFTALPFFWGLVLTIRGAVAAYHGLAFKYPYTQQFILENMDVTPQHTDQVIKRKEPQIPPTVGLNKASKFTFG